MGELTLKMKVINKLSDILFDLFLKINGYTKEQYYAQWIGYTKKEHKEWLKNRKYK
mgnify:CR=1 FL=1